MLPKIDVPIYSVKLLSLKDLVKFRPFTVKEEKLLLMASEAEDATATVDTIKQIMNNCVLTELEYKLRNKPFPKGGMNEYPFMRRTFKEIP